MFNPDLRQTGLSRVAEAMERHSRASIRLFPHREPDENIALGVSTMGGRPHLPLGEPWPEAGGHPLAFTCQINLAETAPYDVGDMLPATGMLYFFVMDPLLAFIKVDADSPVLNGPFFKVFYRGAPLALSKPDYPSLLSRYGRYSACRLSFSQQVTLPWYSRHDPTSAEQLGLAGKLTREEEQAFYLLKAKLRSEDPENRHTVHRLLGHPELVQWEMYSQLHFIQDRATVSVDPDQPGVFPSRYGAAFWEGAFRWNLLLQLDTDDTTGMSWGDTGRIYFWIREEHLKARDFDKVVLLDQSS